MKVAAAASKKKHCKYCKFSGVFLPTTASLLAFQVLNRPLRRNHLTFISGLHAYLIMSCRYCICCLYTQYVVVVVAIAIAFFHSCCVLQLFSWYVLFTCEFFISSAIFFCHIPLLIRIANPLRAVVGSLLLGIVF